MIPILNPCVCVFVCVNQAKSAFIYFKHRHFFVPTKLPYDIYAIYYLFIINYLSMISTRYSAMIGWNFLRYLSMLNSSFIHDFYPCFISHDFWNNFELKLTKSKFFSPRGSVEIHQNFIRNLDRLLHLLKN